MGNRIAWNRIKHNYFEPPTWKMCSFIYFFHLHRKFITLSQFPLSLCFLFWTKTKSGFVWCVQYCRLRPEFGFKISSWEEWPVLKIVWPRLSSLTRLTSANSNSPFPLFRWGARTGSLSKYLFKADFKHIVVGTLFVWNPCGDIYELTSSEGANSRMAYHHYLTA